MRYIFTFYALKKVLLLNKNKKSFKIVFGIFVTFSWHKLLKLSWKTIKAFTFTDLLFFTLSAKDVKSKFTSVYQFFLSVYIKRKKQFYFRFFLFLILYKKTKKKFYFRFSVFSFLYKKRKKAILLPFFVCEQKPKKTITVRIFTSGISCI